MGLTKSANCSLSYAKFALHSKMNPLAWTRWRQRIPISAMGANSCCFTSENIREEAKAQLNAGIKDDKRVQFSAEAEGNVPNEVKAARAKDRKGTGYVKPEMFKDLVEEEDD
eukprot:s1015_g14.t1